MSYQVVKGWPADGVIDEIVKPATDVDLKEGQVCALDDDGEGLIAEFNVDGSDAGAVNGFVVDEDTMSDKVTVLMGIFMLEVDADHYAAGTYTPNTKVTADEGKFDLIAASGDDRPVVGTVRSVDASSGKMRILFGK